MRRTVTLGPWGSSQAEREFARLLAEGRVSDGRPAGPEATVDVLLLALLKHAQGHYVRPDGSTTHEVDEYKLVARYVREVYGHTPTREF
jgi:hypothetical protein